jgi:hypothetical protein
MQKSRYISKEKTGNAGQIINSAYAQARLSGILCAVAHGKLSFCPLSSLRADKKNLPLQGKNASEVAFHF